MGRGFQPRFPRSIPNSVPVERDGGGQGGPCGSRGQRRSRSRGSQPQKRRAGSGRGAGPFSPSPPKFRVGSREGGEKGRRRLELGRADFWGGKRGGGRCLRLELSAGRASAASSDQSGLKPSLGPAPGLGFNGEIPRFAEGGGWILFRIKTRSPPPAAPPRGSLTPPAPGSPFSGYFGKALPAEVKRRRRCQGVKAQPQK